MKSYKNGVLVKFDENCCMSKDCQYQTECAQHNSAGDYRAEDGFRPILGKERDQIICFTKTTKPITDPDINLGCTFPQEKNTERGFGMVSVDELNTIKGLETRDKRRALKNKIAKIIDSPGNRSLETIISKISKVLERFPKND